jgi:hypothetical protein
MIAILIYIFVLRLVWRWLCRSTATYVEIAPLPPSMPVTILTPSIVIHVHLAAPNPALRLGAIIWPQRANVWR